MGIFRKYFLNIPILFLGDSKKYLVRWKRFYGYYVGFLQSRVFYHLKAGDRENDLEWTGLVKAKL